MSLILTWINIAGALFTLYCLRALFKNYVMSPRMNFYVFLCITSIVMLLFSQFYSLVTVAINWKLKLVTVYWWTKTLYFVWAIRFTLLRKDGRTLD